MKTEESSIKLPKKKIKHKASKRKLYALRHTASPFMMTGVSSVIEYSLYTYRLNNSQKFSPSSREYQYDLFRSSYSSLLGCFLFQPSCTTPSLTSRVDRVEFC